MIHRWPITPVPAEHHPSLSLEVLQAEKSIYAPGTWAWSPRANIRGRQHVAPQRHPLLGASGLVQSLESLAVPPDRLLYPKTSWSALRGQASPETAGKHQTLESTGKEKANPSRSCCPSGTFPRWSSDT